MRIAYIANYQGADLVKSRPCQGNLSLAARVKIQLVAELLQKNSHEVEIISQGSLEPLVGADLFRFRFYRSFLESDRFHPDIQIHYLSALAIKFMTGVWESTQAQRLLRFRHKLRPYDAIIIYNLQRAQIGCAHYAKTRLNLPIILQYEDDALVNIHGKVNKGIRSRYHRQVCRNVLKFVSGGTGVSPYLLSQMPHDIPKLLLRGVVSNEILKFSRQPGLLKKNWVVFSGTHEGTQGLAQMVKAWNKLGASDWELHIAGQGPLTPLLKELAQGNRSIVFHGLLNREENARLLCAAKIGMNPQDLTQTLGNVFPFKMMEYLAADTHVITTPRGTLEPELESGVTYIPDNAPETIASCLQQVLRDRHYERTAANAAVRIYGPDAVSKSLNALLDEVIVAKRK
jgi:glycosyltransferase involved in cell wall biosynthesis